MKKPAYFLINAVDHQKKALATFELPPEYHRTTLRAGEFAKLMLVFSQGDSDPVTERMWVQVIERDGKTYTGTLENVPSTKGPIRKGDRLMFSEVHIINIHPPRVYFGETLTLE